MDKNTLSNYGWIVIAVLVLSVMIALATPFGQYVEQGVRATTEGLFDTSKNAVNSAFEDLGVQMDDQKFEEGYEGGQSVQLTAYATFTKYLDCQYGCDVWTHIDECWKDCPEVTLSWEELKDPSNGEKYMYNHEAVSDNSIGDMAFVFTNGLKTVVLPDTIKTIGSEAFAYTGLKNIIFSKNLTTIGSEAFSSTQLKEVILPDTVTTIGVGAFRGCPITNLKLSKSITKINDNCFEGICISDFVIPDNITEIGGQAFLDSSIVNLTLPKKLTSINEMAFMNSYSLETIVFPESEFSIGGSAFEGCSSLTELIIPTNTKVIWNLAFVDCDALKVIKVLGAEKIHGSAFARCNSLTTLYLPNNLTYFGDWMLYDTQITDIYFDGTEERWNEIVDPLWNAGITTEYKIHFND